MKVHTYAKLGIFIDRFIAGTIDLLIVESDAGLGKTSLVREKLKGIKHLSINSHTTPLANYKQLYYHKDELLWFDDVYYLLLNELNVAIMKQLCETQEYKSISYFTTSELIGNVPESFKTTSKVIITCNSLDRTNLHILAVKDRGFYVRFEPTRTEVLNKMREVTEKYTGLEDNEKKEVLDLIEFNINNITNPSLRSLVKGFQLYQYYKLTGIDWKEDLLKELGVNEKLIKLNELMVKYDSDIDRLREWSWSRPCYYFYKKSQRQCISENG